MNATLTLPLVNADSESPFSEGLARALTSIHLNAGGSTETAPAVEAAARALGAAILEGDTWVEAADVPSLDLQALRSSPVVSDGTADAPIVVHGSRLYLARYREYERTIETRLSELNHPVEGIDADRLRALLDQHFPPAGVAPDWQKVAAANAVLRRLCVISGGPGTGKTTTVVRILAILLTLDPSLKIAIAAPTGKAAARVQESIRQQVAAMKLPAAVEEAMRSEPYTLHRLLGYQDGRVGFRHDARNPLPKHVVVVDEASMLDTALAAKLLGALRRDARLILLGDKDQLSSVEAGAVYAGISSGRSFDAEWSARLSSLTGQTLPAMNSSAGNLPNAVTWLEHSYRFGAGSALGRLARAVNAGDAVAVREFLLAGDAAVRWSATLPAPRTLAEQLFEGFRNYAEAVHSHEPGRGAVEVFRRFDEFRVLCSTREGTYGSTRIGALLVETLRRHLGASAHETWFAGRPVLVTANDYSLRLFNGDVGIVLPDERGRPVVHFPAPDGVRRVYPSRLGATQDAMAMTVHRAQGSEFGEVSVVLEPTITRVLSRQLVYTAVTRAKRAVQLWAPEQLLSLL